MSDSPPAEPNPTLNSAGLANRAAAALGLAGAEVLSDESTGVSTFAERLRAEGLRVAIAFPSSDASASFIAIAQLVEECLVLLVSERWQDAQEVAEGLATPAHLSVLWIGPDDVAALEDGVGVRELLCLKIFLRDGLGLKMQETETTPQRLAQYGRAVAERSREGVTFSDAQAGTSMVVRHPYVDRAVEALADGRSVALIGQSSSGKSSIASDVLRTLSLRRIPALSLALGEIASLPVDAVNRVLFGAPPKGVVFLDDTQSSPAGARMLLSALALSRRHRDDSVLSALVCAWPEFSADVLKDLEGCLVLTVRADQVASRIAEELVDDEAAAREALSLFGDDLALLVLALTTTRRQGQLSLTEMAQSLIPRVDLVDNDTVRQVLYVVACLGRYDLPTSTEFLCAMADVEPSVVDALVQARCLRLESSHVRLGHRSRCSLLVEWLEQNWGETQGLPFDGGATAVLVDYLRAIGPARALTTLRFVERVLGFRDPDLLGGRSAALVSVWQAFLALLDNVRRQQDTDATWGGTPSSCMYAVEILYEVGDQVAAEPTLEFLASHVHDDRDGTARIDLNAFATVEDFHQIRLRMADEDRQRVAAGKAVEFPASDLEPDRMHESWLLGVLLSAAATASPDSDLARSLRATIASRQLESGAFYPARVPWVTCRVLLGLARAGESIHNSEVVRSAAEWLMADASRGGAKVGQSWPSGTGSWNSRIEATGMALLALDRVGIDLDQPKLAPSLNWLLNTRDEWTSTGRELDGALALHTAVAAGSRWDSLANEALKLSAWGRGEALWQKATAKADEVLDQSCRVAQIAADLVSIGWSAVRTDVPVLVESLALPREYRDRLAQEVLSGEPFLPTRTIPQDGAILSVDKVEEALAAIDRVSLSECRVVGRYRRYDEQARHQLKRLTGEMVRALRSPTGQRENHLIWAAPGSGKTFLIEQIAASLPDVNYIERNLARDSQAHFEGLREEIDGAQDPVLVLVDEVDARSNEDWPLESFFSSLDLNTGDGRRVVWVLIGSKSGGLNALVAGLRSRNKGEDLVTRVPEHNRLTLPALRVEDRVVVTISAILDAASGRSTGVREVEKLALYYPLSQESFDSLRQLAELVSRAVARLAHGHEQLLYDDLFDRGDTRNQRFFINNSDAAERLSGTFIRLEE